MPYRWATYIVGQRSSFSSLILSYIFPCFETQMKRTIAHYDVAYVYGGFFMALDQQQPIGESGAHLT